MKRIILLASVPLCLTSPLRAQDNGRPAVASDSVPATIAEAEAEGGRYARSSGAESYAMWFDTAAHAGTRDRRCVDVGSAAVVRSGDMFAGSFAYALASPRGKEAKFWLQPTHPAAAGVPVTFVIRAARLDSATTGWVRESDTVTPAKTMPKAAAMPMGLWLPSRGVWMLIATGGSDWGCFIMNWK